jgi:Adenylylsulphate kinase
MVATTHMLAAGALALKARSLKHGLALGVLSHLMLDAVPHRDYRWNALGGLALGVDLAGGALTVGKLSGGSRVVLAGALGGVLAGLTGIDAPYEAPSQPDLVLHSGKETVDVAVARVMQTLSARLLHPPQLDRSQVD